MGVIRYTDSERDLLARIMRAEAIGEGELGMLLVGNVVVNRVIADCLTFSSVNSIYSAIYQKNQFSGINSSTFYSNPTTKEKNLAKRLIKGEYFHPATNALWFYAPGNNSDCTDTWYNQLYAGKFKNHCFYEPLKEVCREIH